MSTAKVYEFAAPSEDVHSVRASQVLSGDKIEYRGEWRKVTHTQYFAKASMSCVRVTLDGVIVYWYWPHENVMVWRPKQ